MGGGLPAADERVDELLDDRDRLSVGLSADRFPVLPFQRKLMIPIIVDESILAM